MNNEFIIQDKAYLTHKCASVGFVMFRTKQSIFPLKVSNMLQGLGGGGAGE